MKKDSTDPDHEKDMFNKQNATFKSGIKRGGGHMYENLKRFVPCNEGAYRIKYDGVDAKITVPELKTRMKNQPNVRMFRLSGCVNNKAECTLASRKAAKL